MVHPFWQGALQHLARELETSADVRESLRQSVANFTSTVTADNRPTTAVVWNMSPTDHMDATSGPTTDDAGSGMYLVKTLTSTVLISFLSVVKSLNICFTLVRKLLLPYT